MNATPEQRLIIAMLSSPRIATDREAALTLAADVSWERFLAVADEQLKPYLHWVCGSEPFASAVPPSVAQTLAKARLASGMRNLRWAAELRRIVESFRNEPLALVLVKGAVLQRTVYPDPSTRPMSDADLVVRREDMAAVRRVMARLGFTPGAVQDGPNHAAGREADQVSAFVKQAGNDHLFVEAHTRLELEVPAYSGPAPLLWTHCIEVAGTDGLRVPTVEPRIALRHLCVHLAKHDFEHGLMWLLDVRLFLELHGASIRWDEFLNGCDASARPLIEFTLMLVRDWLGADVPSGLRGLADPAENEVAVSLAWDQMWDYFRSRGPPRVLRLLMARDARGIWRYTREGVRQWIASSTHSDAHPLAYLGRRFVSRLKNLRAAYREVDLTHAGMRHSSEVMRRCEQRASRLRLLLRPPEG